MTVRRITNLIWKLKGEHFVVHVSLLLRNSTLTVTTISSLWPSISHYALGGSFFVKVSIRRKHVSFSQSSWNTHHQVNGHQWWLSCPMHPGKNGSLMNFKTTLRVWNFSRSNYWNVVVLVFNPLRLMLCSIVLPPSYYTFFC